MVIVLKGSKIITKDNLHAELKIKLGLPDHYGENLDALWDCLTEWIDLPMTISWEEFSRSKENLGEYADKVLELFQEAEEELEGFKIEIK